MGEISASGKWIDSQTGAVVDSEPQEGRLLVAPGGEITPSTQQYIDDATASAPVKTVTTTDTEAADDAEGDERAAAPKETATQAGATETSALDSANKPTATKR